MRSQSKTEARGFRCASHKRSGCLRGPAITEIDSPPLHGEGRLTGGEPARSCPRNLPPAPTGGNSVGTDVRIWREVGTGPDFREASIGSRMAARGLEGFSRLLEPAPSVTSTPSPHRRTAIPV